MAAVAPVGMAVGVNIAVIAASTMMLVTGSISVVAVKNQFYESGDELYGDSSTSIGIYLGSLGFDQIPTAAPSGLQFDASLHEGLPMYDPVNETDESERSCRHTPSSCVPNDTQYNIHSNGSFGSKYYVTFSLRRVQDNSADVK